MCQSKRWAALYCHYRKPHTVGGHILCGKSNTPMHVRTGAFVERNMYMWAERVDAEVEAEWALLEAPEHASYNQAAVFNIRVHFNSYLFRYSWQRRRHGERGVAFLFPGRRAALLRFLWGAKGQDEKDRHSEGGWGVCGAEEKSKLT